MADGRKYEEIKVIKNPLLLQNILAEEITGLSFIVPAVEEKPKVADNGSCQGLQVPQIGEKAEGSDGKPLDTQIFTDIPLDVSESSEDSKPQESPQPSDKQEESTKSFGLRSILPSFVPLLGSQPLKSHAPKESEAKTSPKESQVVKSSPETVVQQLTPVLAETVTASSGILSSSRNGTPSHILYQNVLTAPSIHDGAIANLRNYAYHSPAPAVPPVPAIAQLSSTPVQSPLSSASILPSDTTQLLSASLPSPLVPPPALPPPLAPPPTSSNVNQTGSTNPYTLKRLHHANIASTSGRPAFETSYFTPSCNSSFIPSNILPEITSQISSISKSTITQSVTNINTTMSSNTYAQPNITSSLPIAPPYSSNILPVSALEVTDIPMSSAVESVSKNIVVTSNTYSPLNDALTSESYESSNLKSQVHTLNTEPKPSPTENQIIKRIETPDIMVSQTTSVPAEDFSAITTPSSRQTPIPVKQPSAPPVTSINDGSAANLKSHTYHSSTLTAPPLHPTIPQLFASSEQPKLSSDAGLSPLPVLSTFSTPSTTSLLPQQSSCGTLIPPIPNKNPSSGNPYSLNNSLLNSPATSLPPLENPYFVPSQIPSGSSFPSTSHLPVFSNGSLSLQQSSFDGPQLSHKKEAEIASIFTSTPSSLSMNSPTSSPQTCSLAPNLSSSVGSIQMTKNTTDFFASSKEDSKLEQHLISSTSSPPLSASVHPPPITNVNKVGNTNPYTLKRSHNATVTNLGPNTSVANSGIIYFPNQNSIESNHYNIFSGPQINSNSVTSTFPSSSAESHIVPSSSESHNFEPNPVGRVQSVPLIQSFTSALTNFISPQKQLSDSSINVSSIIETKESIHLQPAEIQCDISTMSIDSNHHHSSSNSQQTGSAYQLERTHNQLSSNSNDPASSVPLIPMFNAFNLMKNNEVGTSKSNSTHTVPTISNETVCIPSIRTALSSVATSGSNDLLETNTDLSNSSINPDLLQSESKIASSHGKDQHLGVPSFKTNLFNNNITDNQVNVSNSFSELNNIINNNPLQTAASFLAENNNKLENTSPQNLSNLVENLKLNSNNGSISVVSQKYPSNAPINVSSQTFEPQTKEEIFQPINNSCVDPTISVPVIQPIPTFNYFAQQESFLTPSLEPSMSKQPPELPTSSFFKPIGGPNFSNTSLSTQSSTERHPVSTGTYSIPPSSSKIIFPPPNTLSSGKIIFPPPNISCPQKTSVVAKTVEKIKNPPEREENEENKLDFEELDQIPLEGSAVPLYNPDYIKKKIKKEDSADTSNTYRLSSRGLKKPSYAPVPELGVTERKNYPEATSPSNISISSQEEMAAIEAQSHRGSRVSPTQHQGKTSPSNSTTLETYYTNLMQPSYRPPYYHWFYKSGQHKSSPWVPFSMADSLNLEQIYTSSEISEETKVPTDGGRYDVEIIRRRKTSVYWEEPPGEVRRCAWFVKSPTDSRFVPYDENIAALLEDEYKNGFETNDWNRRIELADGEVIILHSPTAMAHHVRSSSPDAWGTQPSLQLKPRVVKRGVEDFNIPKGEPKQVDHLLLMVHGVGNACDLRFRSLVEVVDDFRSIAQQLVGSHFHSGVENGNVGRVEILPVEWHGALHTESINDRLSAITLPSIPRAREFTNETLLDILFYTSPVFAEKIVQAVGDELNRVYKLYKARNPGFSGEISLGGHSLGSLILFDILCNQKVRRPVLSTQESLQSEENEDVDDLGCLQRTKAKLSRRMSYLTIGPGTGQPYTTYPQLQFLPKSFFALGSPIGMFVTVRGLESLGEDFKFPTCPAFFNIFHPNDPVAYRIEPLIKSEMATVPAVLIPHHKGRKRMHLELKETMAHVTAALKQKLVDSMKNTWSALYHLASFSRKDNALQGDVNKVIEDEVLRDLENDPSLSVVGEEGAGSDVKVGKLNGGRRVDYVLQEAPLETFNQYISAIRSHLVYWESHDTTLMVLKEIYGSMGISPDSQVPQPILPFDLGAEGDTYSDFSYSIGAPPTQFVRK